MPEQSPVEPIEANPRPEHFGQMSATTEETPIATLLASVLLVFVILIALVVVLDRITPPKGQTGEQKAEIIPLEFSTPASEMQTNQSSTPVAATGAQAAESTRQAEDAENIQVERPTGTVQTKATVDVKQGSQIAAATQQAIGDLQSAAQDVRSRIRQARMNGRGLSGIFKVPEDINSVVYVLDKSGSMGGLPLQAVKAELQSALQGMSEDKKFFIMFYDDTVYRMGQNTGYGATGSTSPPQLVAATPQAVADAGTWIERISAGGGTNPVPAMLAAIEANPELIVLLSDGQFHPQQSQDIINANRARREGKRIDCVGVSEQVFPTLLDIADATGGNYYQASARP